jgi:hypothetical protein
MVWAMPGIGLWAAVLFACGGRAESAPVQPEQDTEVCARLPAAQGFTEPSAAYTRYAESMNAGRWCDAIATFAPAQRMSLVAATFKGLALMAGLETPNRRRFQRSLEGFCRKHGLQCSSSVRAAALSAAVLNKQPIDAELAALTQAIQQVPERAYVELMMHVAEINGSAMLTYPLALNDLVVTGDTAKAVALAGDGRRIPVPFLKTGSGWMLTEP